MHRPALLLALVACHGRPDTADPDSDPVETFDDDLGVTCAVSAEPLRPVVTPVRSFPFLPTSNGYVSAQYAIDARGVPVRYTDGTTGSVDQLHQVATFTDHLPARPTPDTSTRDLLWDAYFGVRTDTSSTWLNTVPEDETGYEPGTGVVRWVQRVGGLEVTSHLFAPFHGGATADLVLVATVRNTGAAPEHVRLYTLQNAHAGGEGSADGESVASSGTGVLETRGTDALLHTPLGAASHAAAPGGDGRNPWMRLTNGQDLGGELVSGTDVAVGFAFDLGTLAPGASATRGVVLSWSDAASTLPARVAGFVDGRDAATILAAELADWSSFHAVETPPEGLTAPQRAVFEQSTAVLRMGQVREPGPGHGQILASLPPGIWNISWPRDASYAIAGLVAAGHHDEARDALAFMVNGDAGYYADYLPVDDYLISVARYHGDGTEESDGATCPGGADAGPNVELDDFGLFLWAYGAFADRWPDDPFVTETLDAVLAGVADPLVASIDPNRELLVADSSIWERHWNECFPNGRKHFSYSSIQGVAGLRIAAELSGDDAYARAADRIRAGLLTPSFDGGPIVFEDKGDGSVCPLVASAPEETCAGCGPYDGSVIEIVNHGIVRPQSAVAVGTLTGLQRALSMPGTTGFLRNDDGTGTTNPYPWYDDQEWVVIDLRMAEAFARVGRATGDATLLANATTLVDWVTVQAQANHGLISELLSDGRYTFEDDADRMRPGVDLGAEYQGATPMCGFGPGAYILALEAIHASP